MKKAALHLLIEGIAPPAIAPFATGGAWPGFDHLFDVPLPPVFALRSRDVSFLHAGSGALLNLRDEIHSATDRRI